MLIEGFYNIEELSTIEDGINATIKLNPDHNVYSGHFPNQPVVPGVIQLQIIKEIIEGSRGIKLFMGNISQVKYLVPITPKENSSLSFVITIKSKEDNKISTNTILKYQDIILSKIKVTFDVIEN